MRFEFEYVSLDNCENANGLIIVIDVLRAFSTAAYAFSLGSERIFLVNTIEEAFALRKKIPKAKLMGENKGLPIDGFDYSNSPTELVQQNIVSQQIILRTSRGTQGVIRSISADICLASSFCCASATAEFIKQQSYFKKATFVITAQSPTNNGDEDVACANYIETLVRNESPNIEFYIQRVKESISAQKYYDPNKSAFPLSDLNYCLAINKFNFYMCTEKYTLDTVRIISLVNKQNRLLYN